MLHCNRADKINPLKTSGVHTYHTILTMNKFTFHINISYDSQYKQIISLNRITTEFCKGKVLFSLRYGLNY
jgi:hypothetical protein